jgi:intein/homing endonuclease
MSSEANLAYLAGIVDGEGCIYICKNKSNSEYTKRIVISNTNLELINKIKSMLEIEGIKSKIYRSGNNARNQHPNWKIGYGIYITDNENILKFMYKIIDYLIAKKKNAEIMIDLLSNKISLNEAYEILRILNRRGR